jgi:RNA 2',3'-cyclic 3'-phosphodiesterase
MRLFVAVELSDAAREMAARVVGDLKRALARRLDARWVAPGNMHLTVRFIGYVKDERAAAVLAALAPPLAIAPFDIEFGGCGRFPPRGAPRVIWIGVPRGVSALAALHEECNRRLSPIGYEPEDRAYSAHLTLARIKDSRPADARQIDGACDGIVTGALKQRVEALTVFESRLSASGANYRSVLTIPFEPENRDS